MSERAKLPRYADNQGIPYDGAYKMWRGSMLDGIQLPTGTILVFGRKSENNNTHEGPSESKSQRALNSARVSSTQNRDNLNTQAQRLQDYATARGYQIIRVVKETGSGLNDTRPKLSQLLADTSGWDVLIVEHKDRLTRFGYHYLELQTSESGQRREVVNQATDRDAQQDLMEDSVSVVTSTHARPQWLRRGVDRRTKALKRELGTIDA